MIFSLLRKETETSVGAPGHGRSQFGGWELSGGCADLRQGLQHSYTRGPHHPLSTIILGTSLHGFGLIVFTCMSLVGLPKSKD